MTTSSGESLDLTKEFARRGPWVTRFRIGDALYGGDYDAMRDPRLEQFFHAFPGAERILELGSLEGGHTFALAAHPAVKSVLGVEGRRSNVERARFVQQLLPVSHVEFLVADLEKTDLTTLGRFDAVFCCGLLYHLPEPWKLVEQMARVSPNLFLWTHYAREEDATTTAEGIPGRIYQEFGPPETAGGSPLSLDNLKRVARRLGLRGEYPLDGMSLTSFWPTLAGLEQMLAEHGYTTIRRIEDDASHPHGPAITLAACGQ